MTHKAVNNTAPEYVCDLIRLNVKSTTIRTRASFDPCLLCVPPISKTCANSFFGRSFVYAAPTLWNALDLDIRLLPFDAFKNRVTKLNMCISDIRVWMIKNKLKINDSKTEFIIFRSPLLKQNLSDLSVSVGDIQVSPSSKVRDIGVVLISISLFMIILVVFASLLIFTCVKSEEFGTF